MTGPDRELNEPIRVVLFALTLPPSPMLFREFDTMPEAERWGAWARETLPCHVRYEDGRQATCA